MDAILAVLLGLGAYLLGSVLFAPWVCSLWALPNIHEHGSGNPGATNVYRIGGWAPAALTLLLDAAKGALPVWIAVVMGWSVTVQAAMALCAVTGHMLPLFSGFRGGKGVATALGAGAAIAPLSVLVLAILWTLVLWRWRTSSLASITAAIASPAVSALLEPATLPLFALLALIILIRHRDNLVRLAQRREPPV